MSRAPRRPSAHDWDRPRPPPRSTFHAFCRARLQARRFSLCMLFPIQTLSMTVVRESADIDCDHAEAENADEDREKMQRRGCRAVSEDEADPFSCEPGAYKACGLKKATRNPHLVRVGNACEVKLQS